MTLPATDNFNRADGSLVPGNWSLNAGGIVIISNGVVPGSTNNESGVRWNADSFNADQYSQVILIAHAGFGQAIGPAVRLNTSGSANYYGAYLDSSNIYLFEVVAGTWTELTSSSTLPADGSLLRLEVSGTNLVLKDDGVTILSSSNGDIGSGSAGLTSYNSGVDTKADDWEGGNLAGGSSYPVSLSGSVTPAGSLDFEIRKDIYLRAIGKAATGTTSVSVSQPTGTATDDCLVAFIVDRATSGTTTAPTGWTRQGGAAGTGGRFQVYTAVVGRNGLTGSSWSWTSLTTRAMGRIFGYINVNPVNPVDGTPTARVNASGTTGTTAITTAINKSRVIAGFAALASGATWSAEAVATSPTITEIADSANSTFLSLAVAHGEKTTAGATGASSATMSANGANAGILIALRPIFYKLFTGSVTPTGSETRAIGKTLSGSVSPAGGIRLSIGKLLSGAVSFIGNFTGVKAGGGTSYPMTLTGSVTPAGTLRKSISRTITGALQPAGILRKSISRALAGSVASAGSLVRSIGKTLAGSLQPAGSLRKSIGKTLAGGITPAGALIRSIGKAFSGSVSSSGALSYLKAITRSFSGSVTPAGTLRRSIGKTLAGSLQPAGSLVRSIGKAFSGSVSSSGALSYLKAITRTFTGSVTPAGTISRSIRKTLAGSLQPAGTLIRSIGKAFSGSVSPSGALSFLKAISRSFSGSVTPAGTLRKSIGKTLAGAVAPAGALIRSISKRLSGSIQPAGALSYLRSIARTFTGSVTPAGTLRKSIGKTLSGSIQPAGIIVKSIGKFFSGAVSFLGSLIGVRIPASGSEPAAIRLFISREYAISFAEEIEAALMFIERAEHSLILIENEEHSISFRERAEYSISFVERRD